MLALSPYWRLSWRDDEREWCLCLDLDLLVDLECCSWLCLQLAEEDEEDEEAVVSLS